MKNYKCFFVFILIIKSHLVSAQSWQWAKQLGSSSKEDNSFLCSDLSGNLYVSGYFGSPYGIFGDDTVQCQGVTDIFLTKYDNSGNEIWTVRAGRNNDMINDFESGTVFYDSVSNHLYLKGMFTNWATFGSFTVTGSGTELFLAKYDLNGNCIWAKSAGGNMVDVASYIDFDPAGNIFMTGYCTDSATFDLFTIPPGGFIAKYDSSGNCLWVQRKFLDYSNSVPLLVKYFDSDLFISGVIQDTAYVDNDTVISQGSVDVFISRFDSSGSLKWIKTMGGTSGGSISLDLGGNIYVAGLFIDTAYFDTTMLVNPNGQDLFIAKYDSGGNFIWARQAFTTNGEAIGVSSDSSGNVYISGSFSVDATFGSYYVSTSNPTDMFAARYSSNGTCLGVVNFGIASRANSIISDATGAFYVAGNFLFTVNIGSTTLTSYGLEDIFLAKHDAITGEEEAPRLAYLNSLNIYANPNTGKCTITIPDEFKHEDNLTLQIFDGTGKLLQRTQIEMTDGKIKLNIEAQARGVYNAVLSNGKKNYSGRIVFE